MTKTQEALEAVDIVDRLLNACVGWPATTISWPHRLLHDAVTEIKTLRSALKAQEWQPIDSAPRDGTVILCGKWIVDSGKPEFFQWTNWYCLPWGFNGNAETSPTHWQHLPTPPEV